MATRIAPLQAPRPVPSPASPFVLPPDPSQLLPAPRTHIRAHPLLGGETVIPRALDLIRTEGGRRDGWVYLANWYAAHTFDSARDPTHRVPTRSLWLQTALADCVARGGKVRMLLWSGSLHALDPLIASVVAPLRIAAPVVDIGFLTDRIRRALVARFTNYDVNAATADYVNSLSRTYPHADAVAHLDDATLLYGSHHQKLLVVGNNDRMTAIVGGVDWHANRLVAGSKGVIANYDGTPYFDISLEVDGAAAEDVARLFELRWNADPARPRLRPRAQTRLSATQARAGATVQVAPNFGCGRPLSGVRHAIRGADALIANLFGNCRTFFYAEDQYGVGNARLEAAIRRAFGNGARYGVVVLANALLVDDIPEIAFRRHQFWTKFRQLGDRLLVFERVGDNSIAGGPHAYVHAKLVLVDDRAASIGSVNMNRRSWFHDSELTAVVTDAPALIRDLRVRIWREHLTLRAGDDIIDPLRAYEIWRSAYAGSRPLLRLRPVSFKSRPLRASADVRRKVGLGSLLVGGVVGGGLPLASLAAEAAVDTAMDAAYDRLIDPSGPDSC